MGTISGTNYISQYRGDEIDAALTAATNAKAVDGVLEGAGDGTFSARNVDASPTMGSNALVESGGVYSAISGKQDALTFDNEPVENSVNPVKSGGIYNSVEELRGLILNLYPRKSLASAPIQSFSDGADNIPLMAMEVQVNAVQSGTPSPDSPSPISARTSASVVCGGDGTSRTVTMPFGESVYGGTLDLVGGKNWNLTIDRAFVALDSSFAGAIDIATNANTQQVIFRACLPVAPDSAKMSDVQTNYFPGGTTASTPYVARVNSRGTNLYDVIISFPVGTFSNVNDFKTNWLSGKTLQVVYFIATPTVLPIEASDDMYTLYGGNTFSADCGDNSMTYRQDIGLVIGG